MSAPGAPTPAPTPAAHVSDLRAGDRLLHLGGLGFAQLHDEAAPAVLVCRSPQPPRAPGEHVAVLTSIGLLHTHADAPTAFVREDQVSTTSVLLVGRRSDLHSDLLAYGVPVQRRSPLVDAPSAPRVTASEWERAPLVIIDGHLSQQTLRALCARGDLADRDQVVMVGNDPDDARVYARQAVARARMLAVLPYDSAGLRSLFHAATAPLAAAH